VIVYAGVDPVTGKRMYLRDSTTDENEVERIRTKLLACADEKAHPKTRAIVRAAMEKWLKLHKLDESTRSWLQRSNQRNAVRNRGRVP
jgi:integrase